MEAPIICALCNALGSNDGNLLSNMDEAKKNHARIHFLQSKVIVDGISEDDILQRCFTIGQPKVEHQALSLPECRRSLLELCKSFLKHRPKNTVAECNMCGVGISTKLMNHMINHACSHLDGKIFKCRHCDASLSNDNSVRPHMRRVHNIRSTNEDFEDKTVEHFHEISNQIKRCFSPNYPRASGLQRRFVMKANCRDKSQQSVDHLCRSIYIQRLKPASIACNLCGLLISLRGSHFLASSLYQHAAAHLEVKLFTCRHCSHLMSSRAGMKNHLRGSHHIVDGSSNDFEDRSEKFHSEYLSMIERCFSAGHVNREELSIANKGTIKAEAAIRRYIAGSKITMERRLFCNRLIRKTVDSDGKIKCLLCSKRPVVMLLPGRGVVNTNAIVHAETHLQKPLYRCIVCKRHFSTQSTIAAHLKSKHALGMGKNYECVADEFHEEIMAMLSKCYAPLG